MAEESTQQGVVAIAFGALLVASATMHVVSPGPFHERTYYKET